MTEAQRQIYLLLLFTGREEEAVKLREIWEKEKEGG